MPPLSAEGFRILVVDDVEETRLGIGRLLNKQGYQVDLAGTEEDAVLSSTRRPPDLILAALGGPAEVSAAKARGIRERAGLKQEIPAVVFCADTLDEGAEKEMEGRLFLVRPDDFDQLRAVIARVLTRPLPPRS